MHPRAYTSKMVDVAYSFSDRKAGDGSRVEQEGQKEGCMHQKS